MAKKAAVVVEDDFDDIDDMDEEVAPPPKAKKKAVPLAPVDDEDDDEEDEEDDEEDEDEVEDLPPPPAVRKPAPVAKPPPAVVVDDTPSNREFDVAAKERKDKQVVDDYLQRKKAEETISVDEMTELLLSGDQDKIVRELYQYCSDNLGIKKAKQLLREARDNAKARVTRISGCVGVILDELKSENEEKESSRD